MFRTPVELIPPFTRDLMDKVCENCDWPNNDYTLFMTSAALFHKRWPTFKLTNKIVRNYGSDYDFMQCINTDPTKLSFVWFEYGKDPDDKITGNYTPLPKHEAFFASKLSQQVYIRLYQDWNTVCIFAGTFNLELYHLVQSFASMYFPQLFTEYPRTDAETQFLFTLSMRSDANYKKEVQNLMENDEFRSYLLRNQLIGFEKALKGRKIQTAQARVNEFKQLMDNLLADYRKYCQQKNEAEVYLTGLQYSDEGNEEKTEFEEYLCENKMLTNIQINDTRIKFIVKTFVNPYLPDSWDCLSRNGSIYRYGDEYPCNNILDDRENLKILLDAIFSRNHTVKCKMCAYFDLDYYGSHVTSSRDYNFTGNNPALKHYIPNPHLNTHNCFGQNMSDILQQLESGDMIGAVECCINCAKRINVDEGASFKPFIRSLKSCKGKCIVTNDGRELTPVEAVAYLKGELDETTADGAGEDNVA